MSRPMKALLAATLLLALLVGGKLGIRLLRDQRTLKDLESELAVSRAAWEETAEKKEALQAELKTAEEALKEAKLTLQESTDRAAALKEEIAALEDEISALEDQINHKEEEEQ